MATFYIQLENKLLQISGDLNAENISKALGYVPVSPNVTNELSQRVDNITFDSLKDNPFLQDGSGELNIVDEAGNIIAKIDADGIHSVDFIAGNHKLTDKIDSSALNGYAKESWVSAEITKAATEGKVDLTGYATEEYVNNIDFYNINNNPIVNNGDGKLLFVDENGYIGLQLEENGLYVKDVIADGHTLSQKADKSDIPSLDGYATESYVNTNLQNYATKDEVSDLVDMSVVTELQGKVETLVGEDADKSVRDIAVDVLTETLVSETATEAYDTLAEMSDWIKSHPEDASAMNTAIQKNATDIQSNATSIYNLDTAYKAADTKVLTDAQEYTDNINFYTIKDNPIVDGEAGSITFVDETGYIGLKVTEDGIVAKDVVTPEHTLSSKADKSFVEDNYYNKSTVDKKIAEAVTGGQVSLDGFATEQWVNEQGFLKDHQDISHLAEKSELPTKTSDLTNDSGFITINDVPEVTVPTKVSELENDSKFITIDEVPEVTVPTKTSDLTNDSGFITINDVPVLEIPEEYVTETELNDKGFLTEHQDISHLASRNWVESQGYAHQEDLLEISFNDIQDSPISIDDSGMINFVDESGNVGFQINEEGLRVTDVIAGEHILSNKADKTYIDNLELDELNAILVDTDSVADDPIVSDYITENELETALKDKQDKLVDGVNIATVNGQSLTTGGDLTIESGAQDMVSTTWAELKELRDSASLVAGTWYRITDYITTTSQTNTMSAGHPFDVVVLATGENTLSEEARAVRHEGDISMSVSLLGMNFFYKGVLTVDGVEWFEFESSEVGSLVTSSATPAIGDIVYPYLDGTIATDEGYPIESVGESENEYFLNNKANLDAWKIWYCLDNDKKRFPWVVAKTKKSIVVTLDEATLITAEYNGTYEYEGVMYYRWDAFYASMNLSFLTVSDNPKAGDTTSVYGIIEMDMFIPADIPIIGVNESSENEGFGVIYRMIDERGNDCPYDFKNMQFLIPVLEGQFDDENGTEEWVFTFNLNSGDGSASTDYSNTSYCFNNIIKFSLLGLNFNIFLNTAVMTQCYNNTLGNDCMHNVFNDSCYNTTLGNDCMYNLFERYTCNCNVAPRVQSETIDVSSFGYSAEVRVAYDRSNTLKIYCEADDIDYNDLRNKPTIPTIPTIDTSMSSSSTNAVQNKVVKSYVDSVCNIPIETTTSSAKSLTANIYYKWTNTPTSITITLTTPTNANILNNYIFEFTASSSGCTLSVPSSIKWLNEMPPVIEPGKTYQISIINNLGTVAKFG